ncbi:hypothetical protein sscle_07g056610 [Sclerotinia sclerotiorum 1980 UF-70]|uniref:Cytochrome P450 n=1 Tax=Sclerotinia sclerotiorum (strain ATCC 18683 / 1980 / Ss-1) TaxID=665079 RepID=A0A1D9Q7I7_SCLS1|nr:hypothetical protein sscle_07g056610 [Sclerotinia sclerotiorum 1980 UF-70]
MSRLLALSLYQALVVVCSFIFAKVTIVTIYRLWWHPLARYPGPFFAKISDWYAAYHAYQGDIHKDVLHAHEKYGNIVRYGPNRLVFSTAEAMHDIHFAKNVRKSDAYKGILSGPNASNVHNALDKTDNQRKRKLIARWLSEDQLKQFESNILRQSEIFIKGIIESEVSPDGWTKPVNIANHCRYLIFDIASELTLGHNFQLQTNPTNRYMIHFASPLHRFNSAFVQSVDLAGYHLEKIFYPQALWYVWKLFREGSRFSAEKVQSMDKPHNPLISLLYKERDPESGKELSATQIWSELKFVMVTGAGSPASALAAIFFYLMRHPRCYEKLVKEIRSTFSDASEIHTGPKMSSCLFLQACIKEGFRLSPSTGAILWRNVEDGGLKIDGEHVDAGFDVGTGIYAMNHNEEYFPNASIFEPERWLLDETTSDLALASRAFTTFSMGPRRCLGQSLATTEIRDTIALVLWHLDLRRPKQTCNDIGGGKRGSVDENEFQQEDHIVSFFDGPCLEFRRRSF